MGKAICTLEGCDTVGVIRRGMCPKHYSRWRATGDPHVLRGYRRSDIKPDATSKVCTGCGVLKSLDAYSKGSDPCGKKYRCKACSTKALQVWRHVNADRNKRQKRGASLRRYYGMTHDEYDRMVADQAGVCAICGHPPIKGDLNVDHDHVTGRIRQLLCGPCNRGLGQFFENPEVLAAAAAYLRRHKEDVEDDPVRNRLLGLRLGPGANGHRRHGTGRR